LGVTGQVRDFTGAAPVQTAGQSGEMAELNAWQGRFAADGAHGRIGEGTLRDLAWCGCQLSLSKRGPIAMLHAYEKE
jgi:hypothetical protein